MAAEPFRCECRIREAMTVAGPVDG